MKRYFFLLLLIIISRISLGQEVFVDPAKSPDDNCMVSANDPQVPGYREDIKRSTFAFHIPLGSGFSCTGTLINRNTNEKNLGQYFLTSWHCFKSGATCGGDQLDFNNAQLDFFFNYQSPKNHLGQVFKENFNAQEYKITRSVRLVERIECAFGDAALCEILGPPIPPHFYPYYSGWAPKHFSQWDNFMNFEHPNRSLKQATATYYAQDASSGNLGHKNCALVLTVVEWIWKLITHRDEHWDEVCNYTLIPFVDYRYIVQGYNYGTTGDGGSGSALYNGDNRVVGNFSGGQAWCSSANNYYGRLEGYYSKIQGTLNPENNFYIDQGGVSGRNRDCYEFIDYNYELPYKLWPASYYQQQNSITINSNSYTKLGLLPTSSVMVMSGADFTFNSGSSIELGPYFDSEVGAKFTANSGVGCSYTGTYRTAEQETNKYADIAKQELFSRVNAVQLPDHLELNESLAHEKFIVNVYPNPCTDNIQLNIISSPNGNCSVSIYDTFGRLVMNSKFDYSGQKQLTLSTNSLSNGLYEMVISANNTRSVHKIVVQK